MKINYGINRRVEKYNKLKSIIREYKNHKMEIDGDWHVIDHKKIRDAIYAKHPGWTIAGYALVDDEPEDG